VIRNVPEIPVISFAELNVPLGVNLLEEVPLPDHDPREVVKLLAPSTFMILVVNESASLGVTLLDDAV
jgi:hypothetical protein